MRAEESHVARLGEHDPVRRESPLGVHDRDANAALEHAAVCDEKALGAFACDAELLQYAPNQPPLPLAYGEKWTIVAGAEPEA